ncbi:MAG TPA: hypothetical protein VN867_08670 [Candidatus Binataceae bacterium]|nr:hypothetical protein [Candidatus Binataceae bacterium]
MESKLIIVAALFVNPGCEAEFLQFEASAEKIMRRYGGCIERRIGFPANADTDHPYEVHIVAFPDQPAFDGYRADPDLLALAELRTRAIRQTIVWIGADLPPFA